MGQQQYSDLPPGATVVSAPQGAPQYSDLPPGATVVSSAPQPGLIQRMKANFNAGTQHAAPPTSLLDMFSPKRAVQNFGASTGDAIRGAYHMFDKPTGPPPTLDQQYEKAGEQVHSFLNDPVAAYVNAAGQAAPALLAGGALHEVPAVGRAIKSAAVGDTDAAALRGLRMPSNAPNMLSMKKAVQTSRPWLSGAQSLEDLQQRIPAAKDEIWNPYQAVIDTAGHTPVNGPDGMTTLGELEQERLQLSALNRGLKSGSPEALQLAQQKGMTQAQLLAREQAVNAAIDPAMNRLGVDSQTVRQNFGAVSKIGKQVNGKSTLLEKPKPFGISKMAQADWSKPLSLPGTAWQGVKDIAAGRPWFGGSATDVGIREGFNGGGLKPILRTPPQLALGAGSDITGLPSLERGPMITPAPESGFPQLPASASAGESEPMLWEKRTPPPGLAEDYARTRVSPTQGEFARMGGVSLPTTERGLSLSSPRDLLGLPAESASGDAQPMIWERRTPPPAADSDFARTRIRPTEFSPAEEAPSSLFHASKYGLERDLRRLDSGTRLKGLFEAPVKKPKASR